MSKKREIPDRFKFRYWCNLTNTFFVNQKNKEGDLSGSLHIFEDILRDKDFVITQCTGVKDKNRKLIYEGDIVEICDFNALGYPRKRIGEVKYKFGEHYPAFYVLTTLGDAKDFNEDMVVIGNIFENKCLLVIDNTDKEEGE